jgi:hypothetical protein
MEEGDLRLVLGGLSSLLKDENDENGPGERLNRNRRMIFRASDIIPHFAHASFSEYLLDSSRSGPFHVNLQEYDNQITLRSFALIIQLIRSWTIYPITRDLHFTTWVYFDSCLPDRFGRSPTVVKEAIMADINDLVQNFGRTSSDGADGESYLSMRRLLEILQECFHILERQANPTSRDYSDHHDEIEVRAKFKILFDEYRKMFDKSFSLVWADYFVDMSHRKFVFSPFDPLPSGS